jgi:hypothetical protein
MDKNKELSESSEYIAFRMGVFWMLALLQRDWPMVAACMVQKIPGEILGKERGDMTIQTYKVAIVGRLEHNEMVLLADHIAVVAEKDDRIKDLEDTSDVQWKRIVELESLKELIDELEKELIDELEKEIGNILAKKDEQIAALQDKINQYINKASYFIGTSDGLESDACIDIALKHASTLRQELQDERVQIAALTAELSRLRAEKRDEYCQGCALPERVKELKAVLREQTLLTNDKVKRIKELEALSIIDHKTIHTQQQRIKELEFYLDQLPAHNWHQKYEELQAEANTARGVLCRKGKELTEALEKIVNLPNNDYWDDEEIHSAIDIAKAALGGK